MNNDNRAIVNFKPDHFYAILDNVPLCISVLDEKGQCLYCNAFTTRLYKVKNQGEFIDKFYELTPETQPDGKNTKLFYCEYILQTIEKGEMHFSWLDFDANGEELPLYISMYRLGAKDEHGNELVVSTMQDLRPYLAGSGENAQFDEYYFNRITYKDLFNTVAELTEEWFWIYDVTMKTIQFFGKGREILGLVAERCPFPSYVVDSGMVYEEDLKAFMHFDSNLKSGIEEDTEVRFIQPNGIMRYYRITYKTIYNKDGAPLFSIGKTYDIDKQKKLEVLSKTDALTNCLNKIATENAVKDILSSQEPSCHAIFLIDVDDFKSVNDELGHYFGDITLSEIGKNLHANFRGADIIGRIGGDEFLVFVKNLSDPAIIKEKAAAIANAFKNTYTGEKGDYKISGSIGVALYPKHATTYEGLYKCADKALYSAKMSGKDRFTIYSDEISDAQTKKLTAVENENKPSPNFFDSNISTLVFDLLYQAQDVKKSMDMVLKLVGKHMNAQRCYISQTFDKGKSYSITHEWVANGETARKNAFQDVKLKELREFFSALEKNGIMFNSGPSSETIREKKFLDFDIKGSYLLIQTKGKGYTRLVFGIEDSVEHRVWSEKEIYTIQYVVKMISIFIASQNL